MLGDSLSAGYGLKTGAGWVDLLQSRLHQRGYDFSLKNASISGDTSGSGLTRLGQLLAAPPDILLVELGGNDGLRGLSLKRMRSNLSAIIGQSQQAGVTVMLLSIQLPTNFGPLYTRLFRQTYQQLAVEFTVPLVPFITEAVALDRSLIQTDGIHPNEKAQLILLENIWSSLQKLLNDRVVATTDL